MTGSPASARAVREALGTVHWYKKSYYRMVLRTIRDSRQNGVPAGRQALVGTRTPWNPEKSTSNSQFTLTDQNLTNHERSRWWEVNQQKHDIVRWIHLTTKRKSAPVGIAHEGLCGHGPQLNPGSGLEDFAFAIEGCRAAGMGCSMANRATCAVHASLSRKRERESTTADQNRQIGDEGMEQSKKLIQENEGEQVPRTSGCGISRRGKAVSLPWRMRGMPACRCAGEWIGGRETHHPVRWTSRRQRRHGPALASRLHLRVNPAAATSPRIEPTIQSNPLPNPAPILKMERKNKTNPPPQHRSTGCSPA